MQQMYVFHRVGLLLMSLALVAVVLELVRRGRLKERYALLWLGTSLFGLVVGVFPALLIWVSEVLRLQFITVMFLAAFLFMLGLVLSFSIVISRLSEHNRDLAQEVALLTNEVRRLKDGS